MNKITFVLLSLLTILSAKAQEVVVTQGDSYSNASANIDFSIGEVIINTGTDGTNDLTQGFHQTNWNFVGLEDHVPDYEANIFPNPTSELLNIKTADFKGVTYSLYDGMGKLVLQNKLFSKQTSIQVSHLATGSYSLVLADKNQKLKTFQLIKTH